MTVKSDAASAPFPGTSVTAISSTAASRMATPIEAASLSTGVSFGYLMAQANKESAFESHAKSDLSSAAGLFQFTKGTWLQLVKMHGTVHGLGDMVDHIHKTAQGDYVVDNPRLRREILDLRRDPQLAAMMAGEYANDNKRLLEKSLGRPVDSTDLYMAHFLGPGGAARLLRAYSANAAQPAADLLPAAAVKNNAVFYDTDHTPRSVAAVYARIHHAIEAPARHYTLSEPPSVPLVTNGAASPAVSTVATATPNAVASPWPFETGRWPPELPATLAETTYTGAEQSADQVSAPMPPAQGHVDGTSRSENPLGHFLRTVFGSWAGPTSPPSAAEPS